MWWSTHSLWSLGSKIPLINFNHHFMICSWSSSHTQSTTGYWLATLTARCHYSPLKLTLYPLYPPRLRVWPLLAGWCWWALNSQKSKRVEITACKAGRVWGYCMGQSLGLLHGSATSVVSEKDYYLAFSIETYHLSAEVLFLFFFARKPAN